MGLPNPLRSAGACLIPLRDVHMTDRCLVDVVPFAHNQHIPRSRVSVVVCPPGAIRRCEEIPPPPHLS